VAEVHDLVEARGRAALTEPGTDRRVVEAALRYMAAEDAATAFLFSGWAQAALPHKRLADDATWQVRTDHCTLLVEPGRRVSPSGPPQPIGVPYGSRARLIFLFLQTEALRTNSREVELGKSLRSWLARLGIPQGGKSIREVREQAERISRCRLSFHVRQGKLSGLINQSVLDTAMFVDDEADGQGSLFVETARLSETFFEQLKRHPVPIEEAAIRAINNNSQALDIYCWLAYRLHSLQVPTPITWRALHAQFGGGYNRMDHFRHRFIENLDLAMAVYRDAKVEIDQAGVVLRPSRPPVSPKIVAIPTRGK